MQLGPRFEFSHRMKFKQSLELNLLKSSVFDLSAGTLDSLIAEIIKNPKYYEEIAESHKEEKLGDGDKKRTISFFNVLYEYTGKGRGGIVIDSAIGEFLKDIKLKSEECVDGTYISREKDKLLFEPSEFLKPFAPQLLSLRIPKDYRNAEQLFNFLVRERNWMVKNLLLAYDFLASEQREFIESLRYDRMNVCMVKDLASYLNLHTSTVFRLIKHRRVKIRKDGENYILPTRELFSNPNDLFRYANIRNINEVLDTEIESRKALSDREIAQKLKMNRRTLAKYRKEFEIPLRSERQSAYNSGISKAYKIETSSTFF